MGVFSVPIRVKNFQDRLVPSAQGERVIECAALVDSGAVQLALPAEAIEALGLLELGRVRARTADGAPHQYRLMGVAELEVQGRCWRGEVIELPRGATPLLGAIPLEAMDWRISPPDRKLVPNPESPDDSPVACLIGAWSPRFR